MFIKIVFNSLVLLIIICVLNVHSAIIKNKCKNELFIHNKISINLGAEPFWYQKKVGTCIDGSSIKQIPSQTLHVEPYVNGRIVVDQISNFEGLKEIYIENLNLKVLPRLLDLPNIEKVSFAKNEITRVHNQLLINVPVKNLIFSSNQINAIEDGAIGSSVEELFLTCNNLTKLSPLWFKEPKNMKVLNLGGNKLTSVPDYMFKDFINLDRLELRNNEILKLGIGAISGPTKMTWLNLGYNNISDISENVFNTRVNVTTMDIQYNRLSFLRQPLMDKLFVNGLKIWGNPWQCPCRDIIQAWLLKINNKFNEGISRDEDPSCVFALSFKNDCVPYVDSELYSTFIMNFELYPIQFC